MNLKRSIKVLLAKKGATQNELATYMRVSSSTITAYKNGVVDMPLSKLSTMAAFFEVSEWEVIKEGMTGVGS